MVFSYAGAEIIQKDFKPGSQYYKYLFDSAHEKFTASP
jgi:hypothetical protein